MRLSLLAAAAALVSCVLTTSAPAQQRARIVLFADINFQGEQRVVDGEVSDFRQIGFNDKVSSIQVNSGTWQFCEDADFRGGCITLSADDRNLVNDGFNDKISSARPVAAGGAQGGNQAGNQGRAGTQAGPSAGGMFGAGGGAPAARNDGGVILYADVGYGGASRQVSDTVTDFRTLRFNDAVSSIRIQSGTWQFCSDANFQGRCLTFDKDVQTLVPLGFNDVISSMRRLR